MRFDLDRASLRLDSGSLVKVVDCRGRLRVVEGRVWLTQEGSLDDVFLDAGASYRLSGHGSVLIGVEGPGDAPATVLFDGPLVVTERGASRPRWFGFADRFVQRAIDRYRLLGRRLSSAPDSGRAADGARRAG